mmetsp:Transcript_11766/g.29747  ORF Transcript_11766/g.29747 Transcript_11766/m.29747 type:complete len:181 (-) Transcript_11766:948-1490(-)
MWHIASGNDVAETNKYIDEYKTLNQASINFNLAKKADEDRQRSESIAAAERKRRAHLEALRKEELKRLEENKKQKEKEKQDRLDEAEGKKKKKPEKAKKVKITNTGMPAFGGLYMATGPPTAMGANGAPPLAKENEPVLRILSDEERPKNPLLRARAGGYLESLCRKRSRQELLESLYVI